jgi:hypothetical protein
MGQEDLGVILKIKGGPKRDEGYRLACEHLFSCMAYQCL